MDEQNTNQPTNTELEEIQTEETTSVEANQPVKLEEIDLEDDEVQNTSDLSSTNAAMSILEIESIVNRFLGDMDKTRETLKSQKEMYNASFENDAEFSTKNEDLKKAKKEVAAIKQRIVKQPEVVVVNNKINELKEEMKDMQEALTGYLRQYVEISGSSQFMSEDGEVIEIVNMVKLVRKSSRR